MLACSLIAAPYALAFTTEEKAAQKLWKTITKSELKTLSTAIKAATKDYKADRIALCDDLESGALDVSDSQEGFGAILQTLYDKVENAVEDAVQSMDQLGSAVLMGLPFSPGALQNFGAGDGGTLDKTIATMRKQLAKVDKAAAKSVKKVRKCVAAVPGEDYELSATLYPMPLAFLPQPFGGNAGGLDGARPTQFLFAILACNQVNAAAISGGITGLTTNVVGMFVDNGPVASLAPIATARGIFTHSVVATVAAPTTLMFQFDPLGNQSYMAEGISVGCITR